MVLASYPLNILPLAPQTTSEECMPKILHRMSLHYNLQYTSANYRRSFCVAYESFGTRSIPKPRPMRHIKCLHGDVVSSEITVKTSTDRKDREYSQGKTYFTVHLLCPFLLTRMIKCMSNIVLEKLFVYSVAPFEVWELMNNYISLMLMDVIHYACQI